MKVGKRLVKAREYLDLSQNQVAAILHITIEELQTYEARHYINPVELPVSIFLLTVIRPLTVY